MPLIDLILNLAGLLLWLNWRSLRFDPLTRTSATSLVGTLKRAEPRRMKGWPFLAGLAGLVLVRALIYWQIGPAANWTPMLDFGAVVLAFRADQFGVMLLYSTLSLARVLVTVYFWMLVLAVLNRKITETDPLQKLIRSHLGRAGRWPVPVQLLLPSVLVAAVWLILNPVLAYAGLVYPARAFTHVVQQGVVVGAALFLTLKYLLPVILLLYLVVSYVYLGSSPVWDFVNSTARNVLSPLPRNMLRVGKVDFGPVLGAVLILLVLDALPNLLLARFPELRRAMWPQ